MSSFPAQTNQQRFNFTQRQASSPGTPAFYDVVDGGGSLNSAGFVGSCSGQVVGQIVWDPIMARWSFVQKEKVNPLAGADATQISTFINGLAAGAQPTNIEL